MALLRQRVNGVRLREIREQRKLTLEELSFISEVSKRGIEKIERGDTKRIQDEVANKLAGALNVQPVDFLWGYLLDLEEPLGEPLHEIEMATAKRSDVPRLAKFVLDLHRHHEKRAELERVFDHWCACNDLVFQYLSASSSGSIEEGDIEALTIILPLTAATYGRYAAGQLSEWELGFPGAEIERLRLPESKFLLIQAVELAESHRGAGSRRLFQSLFRHLALFCADPSHVKPILIADANVAGEHHLRKTGFSLIASPDAGATTDPRPIYRLDFQEPYPTSAHRKTVSVLTKYISLYGRRKGRPPRGPH